MQNDHRARRDAFNDSVPEKSTSASYGSNELGSNISRNIGLGISRPSGRVTESGHDKGWYNKSGVAAGTMPGQRNGLSHKYSFSSTEAPKSMVLDAHHQPAHNITSTQSSVISNSWKNSEEEEYTWDEMNSGLTGHGTSIVSSLSKDAWTADDENLVSLVVVGDLDIKMMQNMFRKGQVLHWLEIKPEESINQEQSASHKLIE